MTNETKTKIKSLLDDYCSRFQSQAKAAASLTGVSAATVSQIRNGNWSLIADSMWLSVGKQIGYKEDEWVIVPTRNQKVILDLLADAKESSRVHALIGHSSWGKDTGLKSFRESTENVIQVNCSSEMQIKDLLGELLEKMGEVAVGTAYKRERQLVAAVNKLGSAVFIINEYEKLAQKPFRYFITLFNLLEDRCGIVVVGTPELKARIENGLKARKPGYHEIYSRVGARFVELKYPSTRDVAAICIANGVTDPEHMSEVYNSAQGDLRRVKKLVQNKAAATKQKEGIAA